MADFYIHVPEVKRLGGNWETVSNTILDVQKIVSDVSSGLNGIGLGALSANFEALENDLASNKKKVDTLSTALSTILSVFINTEEGIYSHKASLIAPLLAFFDKFLDGGVPLKGSTTPDVVDDNTEYVSPLGTSYTIGDPAQPEFNYDNDFSYDPKAVATDEDKESYKKWSRNAWLADNFGWIKGLSDAGDAYDHYMNGKGEDFEIDYKAAYNDDSNVRAGVDYYVNDLQHTVDNMIANGQQPPFSITGDLISITGDFYPDTENWQKTIGAHNIWISADVSIDQNGNIVMDTTVHEIDRYNFNRGQSDIASGTSDDVNGRFEELGWAHSFTTTGELDLNVTWIPGGVPSANEANYGGGR